MQIKTKVVKKAKGSPSKQDKVSVALPAPVQVKSVKPTGSWKTKRQCLSTGCKKDAVNKGLCLEHKHLTITRKCIGGCENWMIFRYRFHYICDNCGNRNAFSQHRDPYKVIVR